MPGKLCRYTLWIPVWAGMTCGGCGLLAPATFTCRCVVARRRSAGIIGGIGLEAIEHGALSAAVIPAQLVPACFKRGAGIQIHRICNHRSFHCGLVFSINSIFHARFHFLIRLSRRIASAMSACNSK